MNHSLFSVNKCAYLKRSNQLAAVEKHQQKAASAAGHIAFPVNINAKNRMAGLSYVEVLIATVLIAVALVPVMESLLPATQGTEIHTSMTQQQFHLRAMVEELLSRPFTELDSEAVAIGDPTIASVTYSDPPASPGRRLVYLSRYDGDNADANGNVFDGVDEGLVWIRVELESSHVAIESLTTVYE